MIAQRLVDGAEDHSERDAETSDGEADGGDSQQLVTIIERDASSDASKPIERNDNEVDEVPVTHSNLLRVIVPASREAGGYT